MKLDWLCTNLCLFFGVITRATIARPINETNISTDDEHVLGKIQTKKQTSWISISKSYGPRFDNKSRIDFKAIEGDEDADMFKETKEIHGFSREFTQEVQTDEKNSLQIKNYNPLFNDLKAIKESKNNDEDLLKTKEISNFSQEFINEVQREKNKPVKIQTDEKNSVETKKYETIFNDLETIEESEDNDEDLFKETRSFSREFTQEVQTEEKNLMETKKTSEKVLIRVVRATLFTKRGRCDITQKKMDAMKTEINTMFSKITGTTTQPSACQINGANSKSCDELIQYFQCGFKHLQTYTSGRYTLSLTQMIKWKRAYTNISKKYQRDLNKVKNVVTDEQRERIYELVTRFQVLEHTLDTTIDQLRQNIKHVCVSEIGKGNIRNAVNKFKELNDFNEASVFTEILDAAYYANFGRERNFENILSFIEQLDIPSHLVIGYELLFKNVEEDSPKVLMLALRVQQTIDKPPTNADNDATTKLRSKLNALKTKIGLRVSNSLNAWVDKIRNNDYQEIIDFFTAYSPLGSDNIASLVKLSYGDSLQDASSVLQFTMDLQKVTPAVIALDAFYNEMKNHNEIDSFELIRLTMRLKELMSRPEYAELLQRHKDVAVNLKNKLPKPVMNLIWNANTCRIKNSKWNEYIYAEQGRTKYVYSKKAPADGKLQADSTWTLAPTKSGRSFLIKNNLFNEYLNVANDAKLGYNEKRRMTTFKTLWYWQVKPIKNGQYFTIKEQLFVNEYLYLYVNSQLESEGGKRKVYTFAKGEMEDEERQEWVIEC